MLLECGRLLMAEDSAETLATVLCALSHATRLTDIKGWYEDGSVIGVIFTEIADTLEEDTHSAHVEFPPHRASESDRSVFPRSRRRRVYPSLSRAGRAHLLKRLPQRDKNLNWRNES